MALQKNAERSLFLTLWGILILGFALWSFWPSPKPLADPSPQVELGAELRSWFEGVTLTQSVPSQYSVELRLLPGYRARLSAHPVPVELSYEYWSQTNPLYRGQALTVIRAERSSVQLELPNPEHISARRIQLHLAH